jgi:hypothetical protein
MKFIDWIVAGAGLGIGLIIATGLAQLLASMLGHPLPHIGVN